ncbi:MAG: hypothetical protein JXA68_04775 [Ignavibacteriales bacterium]|nr:hypothetical protein [Ignavibacteriales bacterium]
MKKNRNKINIILFFIILIVWGLIIYKLITFFIDKSNDDVIELSEENKDDIVNNSTTLSNKRVNYLTLDRDPFSFNSFEQIIDTFTVHNDIDVINKKEIKPTIKLQYSINGVIISQGRKTILFEDLTNMSSHYLHEGDKYENIKILQILDNKVVLLEDKEKKEIIIEK